MRVSRPNSTLKVDTEKRLKQGKPLERKSELRRENVVTSKSRERRSSLKRSGFTPARGYDYAVFCHGIADRDGADCFVRRNVPMDPSLRACDGALDGHHLLAKQWLKREFSPDLWVLCGDFHELRTIEVVLNDSRNGILACRRHHDLIENARVVLSAESLPGCVFEFAAELGDRALARLKRDYGVSASGGTNLNEGEQ
jgi:hypothetical protein